MASLVWIVTALSIQVCLATNDCTTVDDTGLDSDQLIGQYLGKSDFHRAFLRLIPADKSLESYRAALDAAAVSPSFAHNTAAWERALLLTSLYDTQLPDNFCAYSQLVDASLDFAKNNVLRSLSCAVDLTYAITKEILQRNNRVALKSYGCSVPADVPVMVEPSCYVQTCSPEFADRFTEYNTIMAQSAKESTGIDDIYGSSLNDLLRSDDPKLKFVAGSSLVVGANEVWIAKKNLSEDPAIVDVSVQMVKYMQNIAFPKKCDCATAERVLRESSDALALAIYLGGKAVVKAFSG